MDNNQKVWPGSPYPLGATYDGKGVNFSLFAENATGVELCLFNQPGQRRESRKIRFEERTHNSWHIYVPGLKPGQLYGFRVEGPFEPQNGYRFNPNKMLIDPYARAICDTIQWNEALFGYAFKSKKADLSFNDTNSSRYIPKSVVVDSFYNWEGDTQLKIPIHQTIIYELHVKGFTALNLKIPKEIRGTYSGLAHTETIRYLNSLGINAVELMPVHQFVTDHHLIEKDLTNFWGYNTIGFFAPDVRYSSQGKCGEQVNEFRNMVKALHKAGIEVILDVVYNHTAEGNQMGPTLSFRGIDNASYYRLVEDDKRYYMDYTGTGNTLNSVHPTVLRLIMDSLRYWAMEMHVDGFRFDLASALAREFHDVDRLGSFFDVLHQDPVLSQMKLIAEPWDVGEGGYQVGEFPPGWAEWNGKYRDCIRDFWRGEDNTLPEFANRITGSSDLYYDNWRNPNASINFITAHDGFTLHDLVSYNEKHNEANGENNQDGENHNRSWNCGAEGPTDDPEILALRKKQARNFLTTLFVSQGVPMLLAGDEIGRTQQGNNNAYCQDNEISWINWQEQDTDLLEYTRRLISLKKDHPIFNRRKWFQGQSIKGKNVTDIAWFLPEGNEMSDEHWGATYAKSLGVFLHGDGIRSKSDKGDKIRDDSFYLMFNAHHETVEFRLPDNRWGSAWLKILDTNEGIIPDEKTQEKYAPEDAVSVSARSIIILNHKL